MRGHMADRDHGRSVSDFEGQLPFVNCVDVGANDENSCDKKQQNDRPRGIEGKRGIGGVPKEAGRDCRERRHPIVR